MYTGLLGLSQETYIKKMLEHYRMYDCKLMNISIERNTSQSSYMRPKTPEERHKISRVPYSSIVDK